MALLAISRLFVIDQSFIGHVNLVINVKTLITGMKKNVKTHFIYEKIKYVKTLNKKRCLQNYSDQLKPLLKQYPTWQCGQC